LPEIEPGAVVTVTGPIGATSRAFDKAKARSTEGPLVSAGFAEKRWRYVHPFTLLHHLHNQPLAAVAEQVNCAGPGLSFRASPDIIGSMAAQLEALVHSFDSVLLVFCEAGDRDEEHDKAKAFGAENVIEGAVAIYLSRELVKDQAQDLRVAFCPLLDWPKPYHDWQNSYGLQALGFALDLFTLAQKAIKAAKQE
jgi:hypothetical protein